MRHAASSILFPAIFVFAILGFAPSTVARPHTEATTAHRRMPQIPGATPGSPYPLPTEGFVTIVTVRSQ
ncbi:MAG TPA: hypothetical protein VME68_15260 [Acidobacteriaceae bacterium]|nr:hypothetical protein [Acidobacteriaceae bacterium]